MSQYNKYDDEVWEYNNNSKISKGGDNSFSFTGIPGPAVECQPLQAVNYDNNFERMFKVFRSKVQKDKIVSKLKEKRAFEKPSDKRRRKIKESARKRFEEEAIERRIAKGLPVRRRREEE
jgi:small subunit ribosomal protein S21